MSCCRKLLGVHLFQVLNCSIFIGVHVQCQESEWSFICVLGYQFLPLLLRLFYQMFELFQHCVIFCLTFYYLQENSVPEIQNKYVFQYLWFVRNLTMTFVKCRIDQRYLKTYLFRIFYMKFVQEVQTRLYL